MALLISIMSRCPSLWGTLSQCTMPSKPLDGQDSFLCATQHYRKPINFYGKAVRDAETNLKYLKTHGYEQPFTGKVDVKELQAFKDKFVASYG